MRGIAEPYAISGNGRHAVDFDLYAVAIICLLNPGNHPHRHHSLPPPLRPSSQATPTSWRGTPSSVTSRKVPAGREVRATPGLPRQQHRRRDPQTKHLQFLRDDVERFEGSYWSAPTPGRVLEEKESTRKKDLREEEDREMAAAEYCFFNLLDIVLMDPLPLLLL
ncbi:unnamed protein product [Linum trigynum]|uniref:Uncharacterized protein n=1 Tax=Linum trigynum TaxID=586398 RepID=A0AAV2FWH6_9ROSI